VTLSSAEALADVKRTFTIRNANTMSLAIGPGLMTRLIRNSANPLAKKKIMYCPSLPVSCFAGRLKFPTVGAILESKCEWVTRPRKCFTELYVCEEKVNPIAEAFVKILGRDRTPTQTG